MTDLAPHLTAFLQAHLPNERRFSRHTVQGYTDCFRLLVLYAAEETRVRPCALKIEHFTVALLLAFLEFLERERNNSVAT
ncbi:MAG: integrase, partial [Chloroflexi bacterium]|nr:integrase [Chloroflexota bacterium]